MISKLLSCYNGYKVIPLNIFELGNNMEAKDFVKYIENLGSNPI